MEVIAEFAEALRDTGFRGLIVAHSRDLAEAAYTVVRLMGRERALVLSTAEDRARVKPMLGDRAEYAGFMDVERFLGSEYDVVVIAAHGFLRPNIVAAAGEMVRGGGVLALVLPPIDEWEPGVVGGRGLYKRYLVDRIGEARNLLWVDLGLREVKAFRVVEGRAPQPPGPGQVKSRRGVPRALMDMAANQDQAALLEEYAGFIRGRGRSFVVVGDRGRGKSSLLGLALALTIYWHICGPVEVVAPDPHGVQSLMRALIEALRRLNVGFKVAERGGLVVRVHGPWFRVYYQAPTVAEPAPLVVLDEAAAIGVARTRRITWRSGRSLVATTVHGYEGSGRTFTKLVLDQLPRPMSMYELKLPIRYPPGDPLEEWIYTTFMLRAEHGEADELERPRYTPLEAERLATDRRLLERAYSVMVLAHYRNEPDDLMMMLDAPHHEVKALTSHDEPLAVAEVSIEEAGMPQAARLVLNRLMDYVPEAHETRGLRIVRIATLPSLQRRGLGTKLLREVEGEASRRGLDWVGSIFSRHDVIEFWLKNGYRVFYISPRYNKATGEKNVAVIKALSSDAEELIVRALKAFKWRLLVSAHSVYRDLAAEKIASILRHLDVAVEPGVRLTEEQERRLKRYLKGEYEYESAHDAVYLAVISKLALAESLELGDEDLIAIMARVVQGKPEDEVASILNLDIEETREKVDEAVKKLLQS